MKNNEVYVSDKVVEEYRNSVPNANKMSTRDIKDELIRLFITGENIVSKINDEEQYDLRKNRDYNIGLQVNKNRINYFSYRETGRRMYVPYKDNEEIKMIQQGVSSYQIALNNCNISIWDIL